MPDDRTLLIRTHKGHEASARLLWERHAPAMLALAGAVLRAHADVSPEDVVQSAFCRLLQADRGALRRVRDVRAWLCQVTRRIAINEIRGARREGERRARSDARPAPSSPLTTDLGVAVDALSRRDREVVMLKHAGGLTFDQIALALDINRSTAASRYRGAIDRLRAALADAPPHRPLHHEVAHG
jgi:RNA polymerase sigma factor (sigma-70 family)